MISIFHFLGLVHTNCDVRSAAFSIVCEVKKKGTPPTKYYFVLDLSKMAISRILLDDHHAPYFL